MDSDINHYSDCVYYDSELKQLKKSFKEIYNVLKEIDKRAERKQTTQISKSLFDYVEQKKQLDKVPQDFFDFRFFFDRVCLYKIKNDYTVLCVGFEYPNSNYVFTYSGVGQCYGLYHDITDAIFAFMDVVQYYIVFISGSKNDVSSSFLSRFSKKL